MSHAAKKSIIVKAMADKPSKLKIADREFTSRLLVGTGKFSSNEADARRPGGEWDGDRDGGVAAR